MSCQLKLPTVKTVKGVLVMQSLQYTVCYAILKLETLHSFVCPAGQRSIFHTCVKFQYNSATTTTAEVHGDFLGNQKPACNDLHLADIWQYREPLRPGMLVSPLQQLGNSRHLPTECTHQTAFEKKTINNLFRKVNGLDCFSFQYPAKTSRLRQHQWCTSIHLRDPNWTNPAKLCEFSHSLNEVAYLKMFFEQSTAVKLGEVAIVTPLKWLEPQVGRLFMLTLPEKYWHLKFWPSILPRNSFHRRWKGISPVQPYPVHFKKTWAFRWLNHWTTQMKNMVLSNWIMYIIYIYIHRLYEPNSNKIESYK